MATHWKQRETRFDEHGLTFALAGHWQQRPSNESDRWHYRSQDKREQLTITRSPLDGYDPQGDLRRIVQKNIRAVELGFSRTPGFTLTEPQQFERTDGLTEINFAGTANDETHRFWMLILLRDDTAWSLFYETFRLMEEDAITRVEAFQQSIHLR